MRCLAIIMVMIALLPGMPIAPGWQPQLSPVTRSQERIEGNLSISTNETLVIENTTVYLEGYLLVEGTLILLNSTLIVEGSRIMDDNSTISIILIGTIMVLDHDRDPKTGFDSSSITGPGEPVRVEGFGPSPNILCLNSALSSLQINNTDVDASGSQIDGCNLSGGIQNITRSLIRNCTITDFDVWSVFDRSTIIDSRIILKNSDHRISGVTVRDSNLTFSVRSAKLTLIDCVFINNTRPVSFTVGSDISLSNCDLMDNRAFFFHYDDERARTSKINIVYSRVLNSTLDLFHADTRISHSSFTNSSLVRPGPGSIADSSFQGAYRAVDEGLNTTILRCRFDGCEIAIDRSIGCLIYHNAFLLNRLHFVVNDPSNRWNDSREGNYHLHYTGIDDGSGSRRAEDGIGDTNIPFLGVDHYPLMMDHYWSMPSIPSITTDYGNGSANVTVLVQGPQGMRTIIQDSTSIHFTDDLRTFSITGRMVIVPRCVNGTHYFRARSYNEHGSRGWSRPVSRMVDQRPLPPLVEDIMVPKEGGSIVLRWSYVGEDVIKVWIYYNEVGESSGVSRVVDHPTDMITLEGLKNGRTYRIQLLTQDAIGLGSLTATVVYAIPMDVLPPDPPRNLDARAIDNSTIILTWFPPMMQDISEYMIMRRRSDEDEFSLIAWLTRERLSYDDRNLVDNTTYYYGVIAVDDDGPLSEMAGPIMVRTLHVNNPPFLVGGEVILRGVEDGGPLEIEILSRFKDIDGDEINIQITESFPFQSIIDGSTLRVTPEQDQAGEGYIQLRVDDGEEAVYYLVWVLIEHTPDPPVIGAIISPLNRSTHLPGGLIQLSAIIWDPDIPYGDVLEVTWYSDRDGLLSFNNASLSQAVAYLSPGIHTITVTVVDTEGSNDTASTTVAVSIWGFDRMPWTATIDPVRSYTNYNGFQLHIDLRNDGPITLTFRCTVTLTDPFWNASYDRVLVLAPGTNGSILIKQTGSSPILTDPLARLIARAETINGTFGGEVDNSLRIRYSDDGRPGPDKEMIYLILGSGTVMLLMFVFILLLFLIRKNYKSDQESARYTR